MTNKSNNIVLWTLIIFYLIVGILLYNSLSMPNGDAAGNALDAGFMALMYLIFVFVYGIIILIVYLKHLKKVTNNFIKVLAFTPLVLLLLLFFTYYS
jgi:cell division protein FtsW (lipid II flippase)